MKKIGSQFINAKNVNSARTFEKDGKHQACYSMMQGEPVFGEKFDKKEDAEAEILRVMN